MSLVINNKWACCQRVTRTHYSQSEVSEREQISRRRVTLFDNVPLANRNVTYKSKCLHEKGYKPKVSRGIKFDMMTDKMQEKLKMQSCVCDFYFYICLYCFEILYSSFLQLVILGECRKRLHARFKCLINYEIMFIAAVK